MLGWLCTWVLATPASLRSHGSVVSHEFGLARLSLRSTFLTPGPASQLASINLCPNVVGQIGICLMTNEPKPGDVSYDSWKAEKQGLLDSMRRKAHMMTDFFNGLDGVSCTFTEGAMYSFPLITCAPRPLLPSFPLLPPLVDHALATQWERSSWPVLRRLNAVLTSFMMDCFESPPGRCKDAPYVVTVTWHADAKQLLQNDCICDLVST